MNLDEYLDSLSADGAMTADERTALAGILGKNPKAADRAIKGFLMQSDYTKKTQELQRDRERTVVEVTEMNKQLSKALKDLENNKISAATYRTRLETIGEEYGIDVSDVLTAQPGAKTGQPEPVSAVVDPKILERLETAERNYRFNPEVSAMLLDAQIEYQRVFGTLDGFRASDMLKFARENNVSLMGNPENGTLGAFERLYKVPEKKHEILVKTITDKATADANANVQQRVDQMLAGRATGEPSANGWGVPGSPVLSKNFRDRNATIINDRGGEPDSGGVRHPPSQSRSAAEGEINGGAAGFAKSFMQRRAAGVGYGQKPAAA